MKLPLDVSLELSLPPLTYLLHILHHECVHRLICGQPFLLVLLCIRLGRFDLIQSCFGRGLEGLQLAWEFELELPELFSHFGLLVERRALSEKEDGLLAGVERGLEGEEEGRSEGFIILGVCGAKFVVL